jgi:hypothetical protein
MRQTLDGTLTMLLDLWKLNNDSDPDQVLKLVTDIADSVPQLKPVTVHHVDLFDAKLLTSNDASLITLHPDMENGASGEHFIVAAVTKNSDGQLELTLLQS